ncbi:LacI family DNA-binding transcriptional regulator [Cryptosporangium phraense]|uniref:LacI family DNA-binding transcriptional regulator n=2 Tax=Cryptosporangium phraense TaxID=2593070 RepID=A0A545AHS5_9ACTN|nr:LacI family DNA-binding transcriptional regulator [Cryptosporangium phraense]
MAEPAERRVVMADVARLAGVSHMTVSRVLNDSTAVSPTTRARVQAAMTTLGYRPNTAARALATGRTRQLGVVSVNTTLYGPASMLVAIERAARDAGYAVSIASLREPDRRSLGEAFDHLNAQSVEGIVAITPRAAVAAAIKHAPRSVPLVAVEGGEGPMPTVAVDQYLGAVRATRHLLSLGHRRIAHIAGPDDWHEAEERERGWRDTLKQAGETPTTVFRGDWSPRAGYEAGLQLAAANEHTAVFVANDQMAIGVLRAFSEAGIDVPGEMSVVGFDDIPEAAYFAPPLTTLRQDFGEVGRRSLALLVEQVEGGPPSDERIVIPPDLVLRDSTGQVQRASVRSI